MTMAIQKSAKMATAEYTTISILLMVVGLVSFFATRLYDRKASPSFGRWPFILVLIFGSGGALIFAIGAVLMLAHFFLRAA